MTRSSARHRASVRRGHHPRVLAASSLLAVTVGVTATTLSMARDDDLSIGSRPPATMDFGVLGSRCEPGRVAALYDAGVRFAELGVDWSAFEPRQGSFDHSYQSELKRLVKTCQNAGIGVVLTLGLHSAPRWVSDLPAGAYVNPDGDEGPVSVPNVVFSAAVRDAVRGYLAELDRVVGLNSLAAIRAGTSQAGELGYPHADSETSSSYWAFDTAAQEGKGLAGGMSVSPKPGWTPGSATWRGAAVRVPEVRTWFRWYSGSVADAVVWVVRELRGLGYTRDVHLPLAGRGGRPEDLQAAAAAYLKNTNGSLHAGLYYPEQLRRISEKLKKTEKPGWGAVSVDSTSLDNSTAVDARQLDPRQDSCRPGDATRNLVADPDVADWSDFRWTVANARAAGFGVVGENPGPPGAPMTGGNDQTDSSAEQMRYAPRYAHECGMTLFLWAFEDDLFSHNRALLEAYVGRIQALADRPLRPLDSTRTRGF